MIKESFIVKEERSEVHAVWISRLKRWFWKNRTLTRTLLLERRWDIDGDFVNSNTLTVLIKRLREKLGGDPQRIIRTVRGIGYKAEDRFESPFQTTDWRSTAGKPAISRRDENE